MTINENDRISNNCNKIEFFMNEHVKVHVDKLDKTWLNGFFIKKLKAGVYIFKDDVLGEQHVFLSEVYKIDNFREPKERPRFNNF